MKSPNVLVLGAQGMLGQAVFRHLSECGWNVAGTQFQDPETQDYLDAREEPASWRHLFADYDYAINCIGVLKNAIREGDAASERTASRVNSLFPKLLGHLARETGFSVIHMSTDGVFKGGSATPHTESDQPDCQDFYGRSKALGECTDSHVLNIRCSIVGRDEHRHKGLLEWLLRQPDGAEVSGYGNHLWNGVTTLQFAQLCEKIIAPGAFEKFRAVSAVHHFCPNPVTNKYDLLQTWRQVMDKAVTVRKTEGPVEGSRLLGTRFSCLSEFLPDVGDWRQILSELKRSI